jgi:hypothetical protein
VTAEGIEKLRERSISKLDNDASLEHIGNLVDASLDRRFERGANRAIYLLNELANRTLTAKQGCIVEYFRANAYSVLGQVSGSQKSWEWEHKHHEEQILALSRAVAHPGFRELDPIRRCQILTNRANQLSSMGRFIDAIEGWDSTLRILPNFAMALLNRSYGIKSYAGLLDDDRQRAIFLLNAYDGLVAASAPGAFYDSSYPDDLAQKISDDAAMCAAVADLERIREVQNLDAPKLGRSRADRTYRQWCLDQRLFLNPINDLGVHAAAAVDDLVLPSVTESLDERPGAYKPPPIVGFFSQMKQEYVSARFLLYEGVCDTKLHFSDRGVRLFDTLDYPLYSLATERARTAFRIAYSLLDKVAFFVNHYWKLGKIADRISFKNVWMVEGKTQLLDQFKSYANWPLRGLYWLSKELFDEELKQTTGTDAQELHDIRNALEHKYLQVHEGWAEPFMDAPTSACGLGISINSDLMEAKALRVMKIARSALIHLSLSVGVEERNRERNRPDTTILAPFLLYGLDDKRKRRDTL